MPRTTEFDPGLSSTRIDGYSFHTRLFGEETKPLLVVIHGGPGVDFRYLLPLRKLSDSYRVLFYDQRGTGLSPRTGEEKEHYTIETQVKDLDALIRHYSGGKPVTLIGHSWGGMIAAFYLAKHPQGIRQAILIEPGILTKESANAFIRTQKEHNSLWKQIRYVPLFVKALFVKNLDGHERTDYVMTNIMGSGRGAPYHCEGEGLPPRSFERAGYYSFKRILMPLFDDPSSFPEELVEGLDRYRGSVTLLSSQCSFIGYDFQERYHKRLFAPGTEHRQMEKAGHNFITRQPERSLVLIREILGTASSGE